MFELKIYLQINIMLPISINAKEKLIINIANSVFANIQFSLFFDARRVLYPHKSFMGGIFARKITPIKKQIPCKI